ncbi:MAG: flagellar filament capping protein FliD [Fibromonadaceae bacterium]|jgi:flagellar capping protein FliD|nr:flagellar filament capping protein FliD [Fibromonadaceae bacterium]
MATMSVGGLMSGLDTNSIVSQLTALEQMKVTRELNKKDNAQNTLDKFKELQSMLTSLSTKASTLHLPKNFNLFTSYSSNEEYATISGGENGNAGQYNIKVQQLATNKKVASAAHPAVNTPIGTKGTLLISTDMATQKLDSTKKTVEVKISEKDTLKDIANKINSATGAGVKASLQSDGSGEYLVLTAVDGGTQSFYIGQDDGGDILGALGFTDSSKRQFISGGALTCIDGKAIDASTTFADLNTSLNLNTIGAGDVLGVKLPIKNSVQTFTDLADDWENAAIGDTITISGNVFTRSSTNGSRADLLTEINNSPLSGLWSWSIDGDDIVGTADAVRTSGLAYSDFGGSDTSVFDQNGDPGWITVDLDDGTVAGNRTIEDALVELNIKLGNVYGPGKVEAMLNSSGEIVFESTDPNINFRGVEIKMGKFDAVTVGADTSTGDFDVVKKSMGSLSEVNVFNHYLEKGQNARYQIDGVTVSSQSNDDAKTIAGTTFTLKKVTPDDMQIKLSLETDLSGLADKIAEFVEEFNDILKFIDENTKATIVEKKDEVTGIRANERIVGAFTGESTISSLKEQLKQMFTGIIRQISGIDKAPIDDPYNPGKKIPGDEPLSGYSTRYSSISMLGILTTREGYLEVDKEKLLKSLTDDIEGVKKLFTSNGFSDTAGFSVGNYNKNSTTGTYEISFEAGIAKVVLLPSGEEMEIQQQTVDLVTLKNGITFQVPLDANGTPEGKANVTFVRGIASQLQSFVEKAKDSAEGFFRKASETFQKRIDSLQERADMLQSRVDKYNARIQAQFVALERSMGNLQNQSASMISALSSMNYSQKK